MADEVADKLDVFRFMVVRGASTVAPKLLHRNYIKDDYIALDNGKAVRQETQFHMPNCPSSVGKITYICVFCDTPPGSFDEKLEFLIASILDGFPRRNVYCSNDPPTGIGPLSINELEKHAFLQYYGSYIILPDTMDQVVDSLVNAQLMRACDILAKARLELAHEENDPSFNRPQALQQALQQLANVFAVQTLDSFVFDNGIYSSAFNQAKRGFFDALYLLYVLRRRVRVNLEHVIRGLRILHVLEALATDIILDRYKKNLSRQADKRVISSLEDAFPALAAGDRKTEIPGIPLIQKASDLDDYLSATPVVHPMFARLFHYTQPFNDIKPIGVGDLKVVKQWLEEYMPGEISHIHNIMKGELKERTHRRLEKTEETFSFVSEQQEESTKDTQSTDRFEMKRDVETVLKTDLNLTANANLKYEAGPILLTVGGGMAYSNSESDTTKTSDNFWREVVSKTLTRVQTRVSQQRSVTKIFETEETNKQSFSNVGEKAAHVSGIYRWLDKKYTAQLFNYGKRMMFEFIIPEPAAFYVESKLRHYEATLDCPQKPDAPKLIQVQMPVKGASEIDTKKFRELRHLYDLSEFTFPETNRNVYLTDPATGSRFLFSQQDVEGGTLHSRPMTCKGTAQGYELKKLTVFLSAWFHGTGAAQPKMQNTFEVMAENLSVAQHREESREHWEWSDEAFDVLGVIFSANDPTVTVNFLDVKYYTVSIRADLWCSDAYLSEWQDKVYEKILQIEQKKADDAYNELILRYNSQLASYENRIAEIKAQAINDLLQGQSEAFNREIILTEFRRACLAMLTKEFDAQPADDLLTNKEPMGEREVCFQYRKLRVCETEGKTACETEEESCCRDEASNPSDCTGVASKPGACADKSGKRTVCTFETMSQPVKYPLVCIPTAKEKGRFIQFLEQAFEWHQLAYLCYPYFWTPPPKWIDLMNRSDDADPNLTAFLKAGSARVLIAVTPGYDEAVMHFIATREPWEGGPSPVIGDPLFIPLYEEIRKQQDDLAGARPCGDPWTFTVPTSLVYLDKSETPLPKFPQ